MLASITPLGERARQANWRTTAAIYVVASAGGGAAIGALGGLLGTLALGGVGVRWRLAGVAALLAAGLAWELRHGTVPGPRRQVNERWLGRYRSWVYGLGFGAQLGAGISTVVVSSAVYVVVAAAFASAQPQTGAVIGAAAGALRGATVLASVRVKSPERLIALHARMRTLHGPVRWSALAAQLALAGLAIVAVAG